MTRPIKKAALQEYIVWLPWVYNSSLFDIAHAIENPVFYYNLYVVATCTCISLDTTVVRSYLTIRNNAYQCAVDKCALWAL